MAVDKLVDSTQLDADLTSVANAIRTKGGTSADLAFPAGFVSAVNAIPTGGTTPNYLDCATTLESIFSGSSNMPQKVSCAPAKIGQTGHFMTRAYETGKSNATIDVEIDFRQTTPFALKLTFYQAYGTKSITITGNLQYCTSYDGFLNYPVALQEVNMVFDFTSCATANDCRIASLGSNNHITDMRFAPNTLSFSIDFITKFTAVNAATLVSLANCLKDDVTGQTLTVTSGQKAICDSTMGVISGGLFVEDQSGSVTLTDFITNTKGWTVSV